MQEKVVNNYLLWELSHIRFLVIPPCLPQSKIEQIIENIRSKVNSNVLTFNNKLNLARFFSQARDPESNIVNLFATYSWTMKNYLISDLGTVLPKCGDLPSNVISQSLSHVIEYVRKRLDEPNQEKSVKYIVDLMNIPEVLTMFPPIIIEPGNDQRKNEIMEEHHGPGNYNVYPGSGYIEDGNHRAIAMAIVSNLKSIPCYTGKRPQ